LHVERNDSVYPKERVPVPMLSRVLLCTALADVIHVLVGGEIVCVGPKSPVRPLVSLLGYTVKSDDHWEPMTPPRLEVLRL
jgi:hypothetical protein